jgi:hypothetical protein
MEHVGQCETARAMWSGLEAVHDSKGHQTLATMRLIKDLFLTSAEENADISEHLSKLKSYWERIHPIDDDDDASFKSVIAVSLPPSWDAFTESYFGGRKGMETDPKQLLNSQEFIRVLKEEYFHRLARAQRVDSVNQATMSRKPLTK